MRQGSKNPWIDFEELQKEAKDDQPTPPPLPAHLQILKEDRDRRKNEKFVVKQKKKRVPKGNIVPLAPNEPDIQLGKTLVAAKPHRITADQIELGRRTLRRLMGRKGDFLVNVHATYAVTQKPHGVKMGQGKGNIEYFVARVPAGRVMFKLLVC
ncbi:rplP, partial [Symbiodinium necroappetens]